MLYDKVAFVASFVEEAVWLDQNNDTLGYNRVLQELIAQNICF